MLTDYVKCLGGVMRLLEVYQDESSTPRDRLLARRTWQHRPIMSVRDYAAANGVQFQSAYEKVDDLTMQLNLLREVNPPPIDEIADLLHRILALTATAREGV